MTGTRERNLSSCLGLLGILSMACGASSPAFEDVDADMAILAERAVEEAREKFELDLPYEEASIETVEEILAAYHVVFHEGGIGERERRIEAFRWGAFIGEVIRRHHGGSWAKDHPEGGEETFPLFYKGHESFPVGWAGKRIANGPEDNVWDKYRYFVLEEKDLEGISVSHPDHEDGSDSPAGEVQP